MAVRTSMATLIQSTRDLINDNGSTKTFTDQQIQDKLDKTRDDVRYLQLTAAPTLTVVNGVSGVYVWTDYFAGGPQFYYWESDWTVQDGKWNVLTPTSVEEIVGHWQLPNAPGATNGQVPPVFATGKVYDIYAAAADLLEMWAATLPLSYDFSSDGQSFHRSQQVTALLTLARQYRAQQKMRSVPASRTDLTATNKMTRVPLLGNNDVIAQ